MSHALMRQRKLDLLSVLSTLTQLTDGRFHRILISATISVNGSLQRTPVSGPENRHGQVWVEAV